MAKKKKKVVKVRGDVSKGTVAILLIIAVVLSVISTWIVLSKTSIVSKEMVKQPETTATASLTINSEGSQDENSGDQTEEASASLEIEEE